VGWSGSIARNIVGNSLVDGLVNGQWSIIGISTLSTMEAASARAAAGMTEALLSTKVGAFINSEHL